MNGVFHTVGQGALGWHLQSRPGNEDLPLVLNPSTPTTDRSNLSSVRVGMFCFVPHGAQHRAWHTAGTQHRGTQ